MKKQNTSVKDNLAKLSGNKPVHIGMSRSDAKTHPEHFDITKIHNFTNLSVPVQISQYTCIPESFLMMIVHYDLTATEIKVLLYMHKITFGIIAKGNSNILADTQHLPFNRAHVAYGDFSKFSNVHVRNRFQRTSVRLMSYILGIHKTQIQRALGDLEDKKLIQRFSVKGIHTHYAINYLTIEGIFGGFIVGFSSKEFLEFAKKEDLVRVKKGKITGIKFCIENFYTTLPNTEERNLKEMTPQERLILRRVFKNNDFLLN